MAGADAEFRFPPFEFFDKDNMGLVATEVGHTLIEMVGSEIIKSYDNCDDEIARPEYDAMRDEFILDYRKVRAAVDEIGRVIGPILWGLGGDPCKKIFDWFD